MLIAGHTLGTPGLSVVGALHLFKEAGLDGAEIIYQDRYTAGLPVGDKTAASAARRTADDLGLSIVGLTPYTTGLNSRDAAARRESMDEFRRAIEAATITGATKIRVYAGSWGMGPHESSGERERSWEALIGSQQVLGHEAIGAGVALVVENHFGTMAQTAADTARLVRAVDSDGVGVLYDQANLTFTHDEGFQEALEIQGDLVPARAREGPCL